MGVEQQEEVVGVVAPMPIEIPLEVPVAPPADNPQSLVWYATSFMGFYTHDDVVELEQWTVDTRAIETNPAARIEEPEVSPNLKLFLKFTLGAQWEIKLVTESGEVLIEQLRA